MDKVEKLLQRLKQVLPVMEDGTPSEMTYQILSDSMKREGVTTLEILQELEDCLNVHVAYNTSLFMRVGSPKNPHTAIPVTEASHIASAYYYLLRAKNEARQQELNRSPQEGTPKEVLNVRNDKFLSGKACKLTSDGSIAGTRLTLPDGQIVPFVQKISVEINAGEILPVLKLEILAEVDMMLKIDEVIEVPAKENEATHAVGSQDPLVMPQKETFND